MHIFNYMCVGGLIPSRCPPDAAHTLVVLDTQLDAVIQAGAASGERTVVSRWASGARME